MDGVCTFCEMAVPLVSRIAEKLALPGNTPAAVDAARDKHATRQTMSEAGLPTPRNFLIEHESQIAEAGELVGFPAGALCRLPGAGPNPSAAQEQGPIPLPRSQSCQLLSRCLTSTFLARLEV